MAAANKRVGGRGETEHGELRALGLSSVPSSDSPSHVFGKNVKTDIPKVSYSAPAELQTLITQAPRDQPFSQPEAAAPVTLHRRIEKGELLLSVQDS